MALHGLCMAQFKHMYTLLLIYETGEQYTLQSPILTNFVYETMILSKMHFAINVDK